MQSRYAEMNDLGAEVLAVSVDSPEQNGNVVEKAKLDFSILSDPTCEMIDAYGVRHIGASMDGGDIARPAVFLVDDGGKISWRRVTDNYRIRVRPETVIEQLKNSP